MKFYTDIFTRTVSLESLLDAWDEFKVGKRHKPDVQSFEPTFIFDSYSCREDKGTHRAVRRLHYFANAVRRVHGRCFVLKCDIRKFFHSIDHDILLGIIACRVKDFDMVELIQILVESFPPEEANRERERERETRVPHRKSHLTAFRERVPQ